MLWQGQKKTQVSQWPRFRLIILQSFVQRVTGFDLSTASSHEPRCVSTGSDRKQIYVAASILNSNSCPTHQLKLCNWVKLIRHVSFSRMSHRTLLGDRTERLHFQFHALEKEMATHCSVLAWRIPGTGSLVGCRLWGRTELDATDVTQQQQAPPTSACPPGGSPSELSQHRWSQV